MSSALWATPVRRSRREELLDAAALLFAEHGFARVTMDDIGAACGISGPALYHHFESKEARVGEMVVSISRYLLDGGRAITGTGGEPAETLGRLIDFHV